VKPTRPDVGTESRSRGGPRVDLAYQCGEVDQLLIVDVLVALLYLTCMRLLAECVPRHLAATALTLSWTVGIGAPAGLLTLVSRPLYARFGAKGFWVMPALCIAALPLAWRLRERTQIRLVLF
jgi:hypothetical protein